MIAIIDYEAGNLRSVFNAFEAIGQKPLITHDPFKLKKASAIVLPGVGAFGDGMAALRRMDLIEVLNEEVVDKKKPYLGICLGMQFLATVSEEHGTYAGLGWIDGAIRLIRPNDPKFRIPHIGWNNIDIKKRSPLYEGFEGETIFYFLHSYHLELAETCADGVSATSWHGVTVTASVQKENILGVQFHPEKSQKDGLKLLENFVKII